MNLKFYDFYLRELFEQDGKGCKIFLIIIWTGWVHSQVRSTNY